MSGLFVLLSREQTLSVCETVELVRLVYAEQSSHIAGRSRFQEYIVRRAIGPLAGTIRLGDVVSKVLRSSVGSRPVMFAYYMPCIPVAQ